MRRSVLTFDIDWAPDWCIELCVDICRAYELPATFFATHPTDIISDLQADSLFEVGIHPNFLPGSSHGSHVGEIMDYCMDLVPDAQSMRTHSLMQSSLIFAVIADKYPEIKSDVSLLLPLHDWLTPTVLYLGESNRPLIRVPYFWEDDVFAVRPDWDWLGKPPQSNGLRVFDFHPVFVALNIATLTGYKGLKAEIAPRPLFEATQEAFEPFINPGRGARTFLEAMVSAESKEDFCTISDLSALFEGGAE
jgi:hypothetical protein